MLKPKRLECPSPVELWAAAFVKFKIVDMPTAAMDTGNIHVGSNASRVVTGLQYGRCASTTAHIGNIQN